jgi:hypothetical protein
MPAEFASCQHLGWSSFLSDPALAPEPNRAQRASFAFLAIRTACHIQRRIPDYEIAPLASRDPVECEPARVARRRRVLVDSGSQKRNADYSGRL